MLETLIYTLLFSGFLGLLYTGVVAIKQKSLILAIFIFTGTVVISLVFVFGFIFLIELLVFSLKLIAQSQGRIYGSSDSPPAAAEGVGIAIFFLILIPITYLGAWLGNAAYQRWRDSQDSH